MDKYQVVHEMVSNFKVGEVTLDQFDQILAYLNTNFEGSGYTKSDDWRKDVEEYGHIMRLTHDLFVTKSVDIDRIKNVSIEDKSIFPLIVMRYIHRELDFRFDPTKTEQYRKFHSLWGDMVMWHDYCVCV